MNGLSPSAAGLGPCLPGLYAGRVERLGSNGMVLVSIPSVFEETTPESFAWARPCFPYAHVFMPIVGSHVWIGFENGDPVMPVWLGIWYAHGTIPAEADVSPPVRRIINTASGHLIILDDDADRPRLVVADASGSRIEMSQDGVRMICPAGLTIDASGQDVVIKARSVDIQKS